jgi:hypothetical protein
MVQSVAALPVQPSALWVAPPGFHPNGAFFGMKTELRKIHARLSKERRAQRLRAVLICGAAGTGKTHLAREYVHLHHDDYPGGIFWVDAKFILPCFWDIAQAAALADDTLVINPGSTDSTLIDAVRGWLQRREGWLLVFDGISFNRKHEIDHFTQFLPFSKNSAIIYTSVDRTLCRKQRLFEPACVPVQPLTEEDGRRLLFHELGIQRATPAQMEKATEVIKFFEGLPLAIDAIGHHLRETGKPLDKFHISKHLTDKKIAATYLPIMEDLKREEEHQALSLLNLLAFFGHRVPIVLLKFGRSALEQCGVQTLTSNREGEGPNLDTTLGVLRRHGLIERGPNGEMSMDEFDVTAGPSSETLSDTSQEAVAPVFQSTIDVIKLHSVVQAFCRDELKIADKMMADEAKAGSRSNDGRADTEEQLIGYYDSWLVVATKVLRRSFEIAKPELDRLTTSTPVKDYREYETHAYRLLQLFPKRLHRHPQVVQDESDSLQVLIEDIQAEIARILPNASEESLRHVKSIFERSSSSSSFDSSRGSMWSPDGPKPMESEDKRDRFRLDPVPLRIRLGVGDEEDDGYVTDSESTKPTKTDRRPSPRSPQIPHTENDTPSSKDGSHTMDEQGGQVVKASKPKGFLEKRLRFRGKMNRNLGEFRPVASLPKVSVSSVQGIGSSSRYSDGSGASTTTASEAKALLTTVHRSRRPSSSGAAPRSFPDRQKENQPVAAPAASPAAIAPKRWSFSSGILSTSRKVGGVRRESSLESLSSYSSAQRSPLSTQFKPNDLSSSVRSESRLITAHNLRAETQVNSAPDSRYHSRNPSATRKLSPHAGHRLSDFRVDDLSYNEKIAMTSERRLLSPQSPHLTQGRRRSQDAHPSAFMPGTPPLSGYTSEPPASVPMSRDPSGQSRDSWQTEPAPTISLHEPPPVSSYMQNIPHYQHSPSFEPSPYTARGRASPGREAVTASSSQLMPPPPPRNRFSYGGEMRAGDQASYYDPAIQRVIEWADVERVPAASSSRDLSPIPRLDLTRTDIGSIGPSNLDSSNSPQQSNLNERPRRGNAPRRPRPRGLGFWFAGGRSS